MFSSTGLAVRLRWLTVHNDECQHTLHDIQLNSRITITGYNILGAASSHTTTHALAAAVARSVMGVALDFAVAVAAGIRTGDKSGKGGEKKR